jgi:hypothetical protein
VAEQEDWTASYGYSVSLVRGGGKPREDVIPGTFNGNNLNVRAEAAGFIRDNRADAVHSGFIGRRRFGLDQSFEQRFHVHGLEGKVEN